MLELGEDRMLDKFFKKKYKEEDVPGLQLEKEQQLENRIMIESWLLLADRKKAFFEIIKSDVIKLKDYLSKCDPEDSVSIAKKIGAITILEEYIYYMNNIESTKETSTKRIKEIDNILKELA